MALPASDDFSGSFPGTNWTVNTGAYGLVAGGLYVNSADAECLAHWSADAFGNDHYSSCDIAAVSDTKRCGVATRVHASAHSGYVYDSTSITGVGKRLSEFSAGVETVLASSAINPFAATDTVRLESSGTTHTPVKNGVTDPQLGAQTDSTHASGSAGVGGFGVDGGARIDNWGGDDLVAGGGSMAGSLGLLGVGF